MVSDLLGHLNDLLMLGYAGAGLLGARLGIRHYRRRRKGLC